MRKARGNIKGEATYHITNRSINSTKVLLEDGVKEELREILWKAAKFSCVEIRGFAIMDDGIHLVMDVPERPKKKLGWEEMGRLIKHLYSHAVWMRIVGHWRQLAWESEHGDTAADRDEASRTLERELKKYRARQYNLGQAMKTMKEMFNRWYKRRFPKVTGTLWNGRFVSRLLKDNAESVFAALALVEVAPVLGAGQDPSTYKWCCHGRSRLSGGNRERTAVHNTERLRHPECGQEEALLRHDLFIRTQVNSIVQINGSEEDRQACSKALSRAEAVLARFLS